MIGVILILVAGFLSVLPDFSGAPATVDYDTSQNLNILKTSTKIRKHTTISSESWTHLQPWLVWLVSD